LTGLVPIDDINRLQRRMNKLMEDMGLADFESRYLPEVRRFQEKMNQTMEEFMKEAPIASKEIMAPLADIKETDEDILVSMDMPGMDKSEIEISITEDTLEVKAEQKAEKEEKGEEFYKKERTCTKFHRFLKLPAKIKTEKAKAELDKGVLEIKMPKVEVTARKKIAIE